jgi:hydroxyacyl-ACP dehydratase HTD2-like protein with hotdog domain
MTDQRFFEDAAVGQELPVTQTTVGRVQMFFFSAATYNGHRIHYDHGWATEAEGYPDVVVHGPLQAAILGKVVTDWMGPLGRLVRFATQNRASAFAGQQLRFSGVVTAVTAAPDGAPGGLIKLDLREENADGQLLMPGSATVELPGRG